MTEQQINQQIVITRQVRRALRKKLAIKAGKTTGFVRNHKQPLPMAYENPRYTGACRVKFACVHCKGDSANV